MTLQGKLQWFGSQLASVVTRTYHYTKAANAAVPYCVWTEIGETDDFSADNTKAEQTIGGTINYFTKQEYDPVIDNIQALLNNNRLTWRLESVQYEPDTNLIHYEWSWGIDEVRSQGTN